MDKVVIELDENWHGRSTESLWVKQWFKENTYQIRNIPFYAKGISLDDVIEIKENEGVKYFKSVIKKSGHSTYRIFLNAGTTDDVFIDYWKALEDIGCSYEKGYNRFYSIDVPAETNVYTTYSLLEEGEKKDIWEFEEGDVGHKLK